MTCTSSTAIGQSLGEPSGSFVVVEAFGLLLLMCPPIIGVCFGSIAAAGLQLSRRDGCQLLQAADGAARGGAVGLMAYLHDVYFINGNRSKPR
jgi:hypothetical protein